MKGYGIVLSDAEKVKPLVGAGAMTGKNAVTATRLAGELLNCCANSYAQDRVKSRMSAHASRGTEPCIEMHGPFMFECMCNDTVRPAFDTLLNNTDHRNRIANVMFSDMSKPGAARALLKDIIDANNLFPDKASGKWDPEEVASKLVLCLSPAFS